MPTRLPSFDKAMARFTDSVVLPTPPLPAPTAMMFFTPSIGWRPLSAPTASRTRAPSVTSTPVTPGSCSTAARA